TSSVTSLRAANHLIIGTVYCMGNLAAGDGGAGLYRYDSTDTTSADNGGTVIVASDGARWKLVYTGVIRAEQFGLQGTGDESAKLAAFVNSAIALPGVHHVLPPKTYSISAQLPDVNVSNVCILGAGTMVHNSSSGGSVATGTIIKWIGASGGTMWQLQSVAGASNQKITQLSIKGITLDANSLAGYCCKINSIDRSDIDIGTMNALTYGVLLQVVSTLNDACDVQNNRFRFACRQIEAPGGICVGMGGSATANISLNRFSIDAVHSNTVAVLCSNTDNNDFDLVRTYCTGSAATSINFNGGPAANQLARAERVHYLTANRPAYALGANSGFAFPARNITIFALDKENGTPDPLYDPDANINWRDDYSALSDSPWLSYTPTISTSTGSLTSYTAAGRYTRRGKVCYVRINLIITTNGTGAGVLHMSLPIASSSSSIYQTFAGKDFGGVGNALTAYVAASSTDCICQNYAGAYPGANGANLLIQGSYECN
ncbi:MAG: hypothetical protein KGL35_17435, partial [Bradyrhizobium sp.]|nr:hypothetical protein [Bradyrhizobium sp.]